MQPRRGFFSPSSVSGDIMLVNLERYRSKEKQSTGLKIYDISNRKSPKRLPLSTNGGVHRFTFDGRYAYISAHIEGYIGRIPIILSERSHAPDEVGRWWMPGQWTAGGDSPRLEKPGLFPPREQAQQITHSIGISPFIVIPAETLEIFPSGHARKCRIEDRRMGIADDVR